MVTLFNHTATVTSTTDDIQLYYDMTLDMMTHDVTLSNNRSASFDMENITDIKPVPIIPRGIFLNIIT